MAQNENMQTEMQEMAQDDMLSSILQKLSNPAPSQPKAQGSSASNPMGDIISSLLSNPEMLAKLPTLLSSVKPMIDMLGGMGASTAPTSGANASEAQSVPTSLSAKQNTNADSRTALLCAMKPYLSQERQNAIDYIVKLSRLGDILKTL